MPPNVASTSTNQGWSDKNLNNDEGFKRYCIIWSVMFAVWLIVFLTIADCESEARRIQFQAA